MAKPDKNRRAVYEELEKQRRSKERRSTLIFTAVAALIAGAILFVPVKSYLDQRDKETRDLTDVGLAASAAQCTDVTTTDYKIPEAGNHVAAGTPLTYEQSPPDSGQHWVNFLQGSEIKNKHAVADRPPLGRLVHSLEHGYTIIWYDETLAADSAEMDELESIVAKYPNAPTDKVMMAPWTSEDGAPFPGDAHIAFTHWSGKPESSEFDSKGVVQYCGAVSGEAAQKFIEDYSPLDTPEPGAM